MNRQTSIPILRHLYSQIQIYGLPQARLVLRFWSKARIRIKHLRKLDLAECNLHVPQIALEFLFEKEVLNGQHKK